MSTGSKIEWTDATWNPVTGCAPISEGCANCYARRMARRLTGRCGYPAGDGFSVAVHHGARFTAPLRWRKPRRVFVCSMGDLFHDDVSSYEIAAVWDVMERCPQHKFQVLTKRPERMRRELSLEGGAFIPHVTPNVWLGVTAENQARADERISILLQTPAAVRFVSVEPMLGPVDLRPWLVPLSMTADRRRHEQQIGGRLDWVICGGETGPGARPMNPSWAMDLSAQCAAAGVPFFFKKWGNDGPPDELVFPRALRREWPEVPA